MNRRDFLKRMGALGLVAAAAPLIFDYGAHSYKLVHKEFTECKYNVAEIEKELRELDWKWHCPERPEDPFRRVGYYYVEAKVNGVNTALKSQPILTVHKEKALGILVERPEMISMRTL